MTRAGVLMSSALSALATASVVMADQPNKIERVTFSSWKYTYQAPNGNKVKGECAWTGDDGFYKGGGINNGKFSNLKYSKLGNGVVRVSGKWSVGSAQGTFVFDVSANRKSFKGSYKIAGSNVSRPWNGEQTYGYTKYQKDINTKRYLCRCYFRRSNGSYDYCWCVWYPGFGNRCYWCLKNNSFWGCCNRGGSWWRWTGNWSSWNVPKCPGCPWRCWCFPPPPVNDHDIPGTNSNIPLPPMPNAPILSN